VQTCGDGGLTNYPAPQVVIRHRPAGVTVMRCYFLRGSHIVGVEMLPRGLSDPDAIARAYTLSAKRTARIDGLEGVGQHPFGHQP
jgi:hypothetical protein